MTTPFNPTASSSTSDSGGGRSYVGSQLYDFDGNIIGKLIRRRNTGTGVLPGIGSALLIQHEDGSTEPFIAGAFGTAGGLTVVELNGDGELVTTHDNPSFNGAGGSSNNIDQLSPEGIAAQNALADHAAAIELAIHDAESRGDTEQAIILLHERDKLDTQHDKDDFTRQVWRDAVQNALQQKEAALDRENSRRMQQASQLASLRERGMADAAEARRLLATMQADPIRQAVAIQGGLALGPTPQTDYANTLQTAASAPLAGQGIDPYTAPENVVQAAITGGQQQNAAGLPPPPTVGVNAGATALGLGGGGAVTTMPLGNGRMAIHQDDLTPNTSGPTGVGVLVGEKGPEVMEVTDSGVRVIPLATRAAGGLSIDRPGMLGVPPSSTLVPKTVTTMQRPATMLGAPGGGTSGTAAAAPDWSGLQNRTPAEQNALIIMDEFAKRGLDYRYAAEVAKAESGLNAAAVGDSGHSHGIFQLYDQGMLPAFYKAGYTNPNDPRQSAAFVADHIARTNDWSPWHAAPARPGGGAAGNALGAPPTTTTAAPATGASGAAGATPATTLRAPAAAGDLTGLAPEPGAHTPQNEISFLNDIASRWPNVTARDVIAAGQYGLFPVKDIIAAFLEKRVDQATAYDQLHKLLPGLRQDQTVPADYGSIRQAISQLWQHALGGSTDSPYSTVGALGSPGFAPEGQPGQPQSMSEAARVLPQLGYAPKFFRMSQGPNAGQVFVIDQNKQAHALTDPGYASAAELNYLGNFVPASSILSVNPAEFRFFIDGMGEDWLLGQPGNIAKVQQAAAPPANQSAFPVHQDVIRDPTTGLFLPLPRFVASLIPKLDPAVQNIIYSIYENAPGGYSRASFERERSAYTAHGSYTPGQSSFLR